MAKCSCAGTSCSCLIQAGSNINITGQGTNAAPYVISLAASPSDVPTEGGVLDLTTVGASAVVRVLLGGDVSDILFPSNGLRLDVIFEQDTTGGWTITWPAAILWPGGTEPTITATAQAADWVSFVQAGGQWFGVRLGANLS